MSNTRDKKEFAGQALIERVVHHIGINMYYYYWPLKITQVFVRSFLPPIIAIMVIVYVLSNS